MYPRQLIGQRGLGGVSDINILQKKNFQPVQTLAAQATAKSAGNVGIGSEYIDSAGGGWGDSHTGDAEQSEAGGPAFADALAADANIADAVPHHEAQAQLQAQFPSGESPSFVAARAADAAIAETAAVDAASDHASPAAASTAEGALAPAAATTGAVP